MAPHRRTIGHGLRKSGVLLFVVTSAFLGSVACRRTEVPSRPRQEVVPPIRDVRVLVASNVERVRLRAKEELSVHGSHGSPQETFGTHEWIVVSPTSSGGIRFGAFSWSETSVTALTSPTGSITLSVGHGTEWSPANRYPGGLRVIVGDDGRLDVVNAVDVETYVGCVVANEVWPTFEREAYRAQAIAARTFVLYQMARRPHATFDVTATEGSQVYRGLRTDGTGRRAVSAVHDTWGIVCTWCDRGEDRVFSTYYSAACGGMSQSAAIFGTEHDIEPLSGGVACDYCKDAPGETYRWGPVHLSKGEVRSRLIARYPELASLGPIKEIEAIERTPHGRPVTLRIRGASGESHDLQAERFRLAMGSRVIRSTDCKIRVTRRRVIFREGRGFGHGLGLCQWGMQGQARIGKRAGEILRYYYPGSKLTRVY